MADGAPSETPLEAAAHTYWRTNLAVVGALLAVWFSVSFLAGIVFVDELDQVRLGGFKLGFWFSQQGSIYVFSSPSSSSTSSS